MGLPTGWNQSGSRYFVDHVSGKWRVSKSWVRGAEVYTLWKRVDSKWALYGNHNSVQEADGARLINQQKREVI